MSRHGKTPGPPVEGRFRKGESGNPKGRPRNKKVAEPAPSAFAVLLDKELTITRDGVDEQVSLEEALQHQTLRDAIAGKRMAQRQVMKMIERREKARDRRAGPRHSPVEVITERDTPTNADEALVLLGIARPHHLSKGETLSLEAWAVQTAIDRMRARAAIEPNDWNLIRYYTADPDDVRWPPEARG